MVNNAGRSLGEEARRNRVTAQKVSDVMDVGVFEQPVLLFGGAYSNLQALEAMLDVVRSDARFSVDRTIHTGDVIAYCGQPRETSEALYKSGVHCLMGNCEESMGAGKADCGCGFPADSACEAYSVNWFAHASGELNDSPHLIEWMGMMPRRIEFQCGGRRFAVVHGTPRNISEFVWSTTPEEDLLEAFSHLPEQIDCVISGHSGIPFARFLPGSADVGRRRAWINAGVIGMPANDGTSRGWYAVLDPSGGTLQVSIHELRYDARAAAEAIFSRPALINDYARSLLSGIWPSHDVLPLELQMRTGEPLSDQSLLWPPDEDRHKKSFDVAACKLPALAAPATAMVIVMSAALMAWMSQRWQSRPWSSVVRHFSY